MGPYRISVFPLSTYYLKIVLKPDHIHKVKHFLVDIRQRIMTNTCQKINMQESRNNNRKNAKSSEIFYIGSD